MNCIAPCFFCTSISFLYFQNIYMYLIAGTTAFPRITLGAFISKSILDKGWNREEIEKKNTTGKNIAAQNHFGIYELSIYKQLKKNCNRNFFFYCNVKLDLTLKRRVECFFCENTALLCNNCYCFSTFFCYFVKV